MCPSAWLALQVGECLRVCCSVGEATCPRCSGVNARLTAEVGSEAPLCQAEYTAKNSPAHTEPSRVLMCDGVVGGNGRGGCWGGGSAHPDEVGPVNEARMEKRVLETSFRMTLP